MMVTIKLGRSQIRFDWQILPFALSAVLALGISYDSARASTRLALIVTSLAIYLFFVNKSEPANNQRSFVRLSLGLMPAMLAVYFLLTNDWARWSEKLAFLSPVTRLLTPLQFAPQWLQINPNVIGGTIAALLPLQIVALRNSRRATQVILVGISLAALALSQTRGAWLAVGLTSLMYLVWRIARRRFADLHRARIVWGLVIASGWLVLTVLLATPLGGYLLQIGGGRPDIWRNSVALISDYPVTGHGLGGFEMVYASYALLTHVGHTMHAHNLWLDIWLEQGLLGLVAFCGLLVNAVWVKPHSGPWRTAALASLAIVLLHGLVDDPFYGYGGILIPLLLIPLALLARDDLAVAFNVTPRIRMKFQPALVVWMAALAVSLLTVVSPGGKAMIEANWGATLQTRAELSIYQWPRYGLPDVLRQTGVADMEPAMAHYAAALAIDPNNVAANRRLGQIKLSMGDLEAACLHLDRAYAIAPDQRATVQLLGECYALQGRSAEALQLWRTIDVSDGQTGGSPLVVRNLSGRTQPGRHAQAIHRCVEPKLARQPWIFMRFHQSLKYWGILIITGSILVALSAQVVAQGYGDAWTPAVNISKSGTASNPVIAVMPDGMLHVLWWDDLDGEQYTRTNLTSTVWTQPVNVPQIVGSRLVDAQTDRETLTAPRDVILAADADNGVHAFWFNTTDQLLHAQTSGTAWSDATVLAEAATILNTATDESGALHLAYAQSADSPATPAGLYYRINSSGRWSPPSLIHASSYFRAAQPETLHLSVAGNNREQAIVAWDEPQLQQSQLALSLNNGIDWSAPLPLSNTQSLPVRKVSVAAASNGDFLMIWQDAGTASDCTFAQRVSSDGGETWSVPVRIFKSSSLCQQSLSFMSDAEGRLWLIGQPPTHASVADLNSVTLASWDGRVWSQPVVSTFTAVDSTGRRAVPLSCLNVAIAGQTDWHRRLRCQ